MAREDRDHQAVCRALINDGWTITQQQAILRFRSSSFFGKLDMVATAAITATQNQRTIVVEVKSFRPSLKMAELEKAVGQYLIYKSWLLRERPNWDIYLAVSTRHQHHFESEALRVIAEDYGIKVILVDVVQERIVAWI